MAPDGSSYTLLHNFSALPPDGMDGMSPKDGLILGMDGALYGTTTIAPVPGQGIVFRQTLR
jgi:hypothetical protein